MFLQDCFRLSKLAHYGMTGDYDSCLSDAVKCSESRLGQGYSVSQKCLYLSQAEDSSELTETSIACHLHAAGQSCRVWSLHKASKHKDEVAQCLGAWHFLLYMPIILRSLDRMYRNESWRLARCLSLDESNNPPVLYLWVCVLLSMPSPIPCRSHYSHHQKQSAMTCVKLQFLILAHSAWARLLCWHGNQTCKKAADM